MKHITTKQAKDWLAANYGIKMIGRNGTNRYNEKVQRYYRWDNYEISDEWDTDGDINRGGEIELSKSGLYMNWSTGSYDIDFKTLTIDGLEYDTIKDFEQDVFELLDDVMPNEQMSYRKAMLRKRKLEKLLA